MGNSLSWKNHRALSSSTYCCHFSLVFLSSQAYLDNQWILRSLERLPLARPSSFPAHPRIAPSLELFSSLLFTPLRFPPRPVDHLIYTTLFIDVFSFFQFSYFSKAFFYIFFDWSTAFINLLHLVKDNLGNHQVF